jgi:hypothetical protein
MKSARLASMVTIAVLSVELAAPCAGVARADTPPAAAPASPTVEQLAERAFQQQAAGNYSESIATYLKAYEISHAGAILFNVAAIYDRKLHERDLAAEYFRRYLKAPDAEPELVERATTRLTALKKEAEEARLAEAAQPPPVRQNENGAGAAGQQVAPANAEATHSRSGATMRVTGVVLGVLGLGAIGGSMALGALAKSKNDDANLVCKGDACTAQSGVTSARDAGTFATASTGVFIGGAVLLVAGVALFVVAPRSSSPSTASLQVVPQIGPSGGGLGLHGTF